MLIAIDYDDTFTRDPLGWHEAMQIMQAHGHTIIGATMRHEREAGGMSALYMQVCDTVYFTGRVAKRKFLASKGVLPHVWIDDNPEFIVMSAAG